MLFASRKTKEKSLLLSWMFSIPSQLWVRHSCAPVAESPTDHKTILGFCMDRSSCRWELPSSSAEARVKQVWYKLWWGFCDCFIETSMAGVCHPGAASVSPLCFEARWDPKSGTECRWTGVATSIANFCTGPYGMQRIVSGMEGCSREPCCRLEGPQVSVCSHMQTAAAQTSRW